MEMSTITATDTEIRHIPPPITASDKIAYLRSVIPPSEDRINESIDEKARESDHPIPSAERIAFHRALFSKSRNNAVQNPDYLAHYFLSGKWRLLFRLHWIVRPLVLRHCPQTAYYHVARTKHIDTLLNQSIRDGIEQFVILGAGNDTRPFRFAESLSGIKIFELDFPATQKRKKQCLFNIFDQLPSAVNFVPIDFNTQDVMTTLIQAGFDPKKRTFFNWEGVCYFIEQEAADNILSFVSRTATSSSIVFDYVNRTMLEDDNNSDSREFRQRQERYKEPIRCGIQEDSTVDYVGKFGLELLSDIGNEQLSKLYLAESDGTVIGHALPHFRIAHARVK